MNINLESVYDEVSLFLNIKRKNFWIIYFNMLLDEPTRDNNNWMDFELEIKEVVINIEKCINKYGINSKPINKSINRAIQYAIKEKGTYKNYSDVIEMMSEDLNELIRCLEIYLEKFVNPIIMNNNLINYASPDITSCNIDKVISFNYTKTFEFLYDNNIKIDYIHGKANINNNIAKNNMILGFDEYLSDDKKDIDLYFVAFKKYYQRLCKETDCKYKKWLDDINQDKEKQNNLFIFGHSLSMVDKDIIKELILNEKINTIIYYLNNEDKKQKIKNLVNVSSTNKKSP